MERKQRAEVGVVALLFDHMLIDHSGDEGQCDDVSSGGQDLCNLFVLKRGKVVGHLEEWE